MSPRPSIFVSGKNSFFFHIFLLGKMQRCRTSKRFEHFVSFFFNQAQKIKHFIIHDIFSWLARNSFLTSATRAQIEIKLPRRNGWKSSNARQWNTWAYKQSTLKKVKISNFVKVAQNSRLLTEKGPKCHFLFAKFFVFSKGCSFLLMKVFF